MNARERRRHDAAWDRRRFVAEGIALALLTSLPGRPAFADVYPSRAIRLVVPWAPGGLVDTGGRVLAEALSGTLGQSVVVENAAGAAGRIGAEQVAKAAPDGYTLLMGTSSLAIDVHSGRPLAFDPVKDLVPVALVANAQSVVVVNPGSPWRSIRDVIAAAKAKPGELTYGTPGIGSPANLFVEQFKQMAGIEILHVPYSKSPAINDLLGGRLSLMFATIPVALPQIQAGKLRAIAVTGAKRFAALPDVPTVAESGLPQYEAGQWLGVFAPANTPADIVQKLNVEIARALATDGVKRALHARGTDPATASPAEFRKVFTTEVDKWGRVMRKSNIRLE
jgi:tripartite-type tricarboxylate transporter receptor subunit TctC